MTTQTNPAKMKLTPSREATLRAIADPDQGVDYWESRMRPNGPDTPERYRLAQSYQAVTAPARHLVEVLEFAAIPPRVSVFDFRRPAVRLVLTPAGQAWLDAHPVAAS
jgi:hypothetical protein